MRKVLFTMVTVLILALVACGDSEESSEKDVGSVESSEKNGDQKTDNDTEETGSEKESDIEEVGEVVADDDYIKATLVNIEHNIDEMFDEEKYIINFDLENKTSDKIVVQARDISIDGTMADDMVFFSEEIAGDKKANGKMEIQNYDGDLPEMNEDIEFTLIIMDDETYETLAEHDVSIEF